MYEALVATYFDYCSKVWGCTGKGQTPEIATFSDYNTRSAGILQDLEWDTLEQRHCAVHNRCF